MQQMLNLMSKVDARMEKMEARQDAFERPTFPAQPLQNPRRQGLGPNPPGYGTQKHAKAITTLGSGKVIGHDVSPLNSENEVVIDKEGEAEKVEEEPPKEEKEERKAEDEPTMEETPKYPIPAPYPQG